MWPPRHTHQLEVTVNIAKNGCAEACIVCPQEKLSTTYNLYPDKDRVRDLSLEDFKKVIDKVPLTTRIDFSGYTEPYLNKDCSDMIKYAHDKGHTISVYTTLVGAEEKDIDLLLQICKHPDRPFSPFDQENPLCIHLPDEGGVMPVKITSKYKRVLTYLIMRAQMLKLQLGSHIRFMTMDTEGKLSKEILDIFPVNKIPFSFKAISRASNLDDGIIKIKAPTMQNYEGGVGRRTGKIYCKTNSLSHNVLIPNGDVQLCCMDYGLEAKIGNLLEDSYDTLFDGEGMKYITDRMNDETLEGDIICRRCENAGYEYKSEFVTNTIDMQKTLNILYQKLSTEPRVFYSRFGDGDFEIMKGNRELLHKWSPKLQKELQEAFEISDENYLKGVMVNEPTFNGLELEHHPPQKYNEVSAFIHNNFSNAKDFIYYSHVLFAYMSVKEQDIIVDFLDKFIRPKKKMFIGNIDKESIEKFVGKIDYYVKVPSKDAYYNIDNWWKKVLDDIDKVELVIPTAGMAGRVTQKRLWNLNKDIHSIELGSIVDAIVNSKTRGWIKRNKVDLTKLLIKD